MIEENKKIAREFVQALGMGDAEAMRPLMHKDMQAICTGSCVLSGSRSSQDILETVGGIKQITKDGIRFDILSMTAEGDRVSVEMDGYSELVTGVDYNNEYHFLFFFKDGKIIKMKEYLDTKLVDATMGPLMAG